MTEWTEERLQAEYIAAGIEEHQHLEYKAAGALSEKSNIYEITKDVSAFANADGGLLIYGILETSERPSKPSRLDPIDASSPKTSKEWLDQVIAMIEPPIPELRISAVPLPGTGVANGYAYVVEVPRGSTAHQAKNHKYYRRYNYMNQSMPDHAVRDVMSRGTVPHVVVTFTHRRLSGSTAQEHLYRLDMVLSNKGRRVANNFKLDLAFPNLPEFLTIAAMGSREHSFDRYLTTPRVGGSVRELSGGRGHARYSIRSDGVLFPDDSIDLTECLEIRYIVDLNVYKAREMIPAFEWTLYADEMPKKTGQIPFLELHNF